MPDSDDHLNEEVGYGKPPKHTQFQKGVSGNPRGRPKGALSLSAIVKRTLKEKVVINENGVRKTVTKLEAAVKQVANKSASGDLLAMTLTPLASAAEIETTLARNSPDLSEADQKVMARFLQRLQGLRKEKTMATMTKAEFHVALRMDFAAFVERSFYELNPQTDYLHNWHIEVIAEALEQCRTGKLRRLIINVPPRSLKSHMASIAFPAYLLGRDPSSRIICASYAQDLADKLAGDCRSLILSDFYRELFPQLALPPRSLH